MITNQVPEPRQEAHQTGCLPIGTKDTTSSLRIGFTDQRLTAHGGMIVWSHFLQQKGFRQPWRECLPHCPTSPNAHDPTDLALGYMGGILAGADQLSRVAWLQSDAALAPGLGVEAKPCHRPLIAALAEAKMVAGYWLRRGDSACGNGAAEFLRQTGQGMPSHIRMGLVRGGAGFGHESVREAAESLGLKFILVARLVQHIKRLCRHDEAHWQPTEVAGIRVPEVAGDAPGRRLIILRQRVAERPDAAGKTLMDVPGYRFQALVTNLPSSVGALQVWRRDNGRADVENRIKELGDQFGIKRLCGDNFWGTEAMHPLAIAAYNLGVRLRRRLGRPEKCELNTLRWRLFSRAAVWSRARGRPTLKLAVRGQENRNWWREILSKLTAPPNGNAVGSLLA